MKLFKIENWEVKVEDAVWTLSAFKKLLDRDKTKGKEIAFKEIAFIYHYTDIRSDYMYLTDEKKRAKEVAKDVGLSDKWKLDNLIQEAIDLYRERSTTVLEKLYQSAQKSANDISNYLDKTDVLLSERDEKGKPVNTINSITAALKTIPDIMKNNTAAYQELIKEKISTEGKNKGQQQMGMFEDGL